MRLFSVFEEIRAMLVQGGWVLLPIFLLGLFAWTLIFERYFMYRRAKSLGKFGLLHRFQTTVSQAEALGRLAVDFRLHEMRHGMESDFAKSFPTIAACASLAPMLGLLGTVSGMVHVFKTIQLFGFGNPVLIADGISEALLTTQAGLLVAFPIVLANNHLQSKLERLKSKRWKQALQFENEMFFGEAK